MEDFDLAILWYIHFCRVTYRFSELQEIEEQTSLTLASESLNLLIVNPVNITLRSQLISYHAYTKTF